ncbi:vesicle transport protein SEC20 isoform X1 [Mus musculus]|uniref:vesicle transport protein SEC20 isoform X1 n=1 Tax=Mus musculus TaxID=10090 RepID=UPI0003D6EC63|nr:vesicle transport protein SEC20 isoform X1 [Mus musculus]
MAAPQDVHVRICNQEIVKFDLEVKALIQDIRDCSGPLSELTELNTKVKEKFQQLKQRIQQPDLMAKSQSYLQACHRQPGEGRTSARRRLLTAKENHQREFGPDLQLHHRESHGDQQDDVTAGATERGGYADSSQLLTDSPGCKRRV